MPLEKVTPARMPRLATIMIVRRGATREPTEEFRKLTASLLTPTMRSMIANRKRTPMASTYRFISSSAEKRATTIFKK